TPCFVPAAPVEADAPAFAAAVPCFAPAAPATAVSPADAAVLAVRHAADATADTATDTAADVVACFDATAVADAVPVPRAGCAGPSAARPTADATARTSAAADVTASRRSGAGPSGPESDTARCDTYSGGGPACPR